MSEAAPGFIAHVFRTIPDDMIYSGAFADNGPSLRIQEKIGFTRDNEAMAFSNPHGKDVLHVNTSLTRARFAAVLITAAARNLDRAAPRDAHSVGCKSRQPRQ